MICAIVYQSHAGYTKRYAQLLAEGLELPVYSLEQAMKELSPGSTIIFLGWLRAGRICGYQKAAGMFKIAAVCSVGLMGGDIIRQKLMQENRLPEDMPVFPLQGGFDMDKLSLSYRIAMTLMRKPIAKMIKQNGLGTFVEQQALDMLLHGGNCVCRENLSPVISWYALWEGNKIPGYFR